MKKAILKVDKEEAESTQFSLDPNKVVVVSRKSFGLESEVQWISPTNTFYYVIVDKTHKFPNKCRSFPLAYHEDGEPVAFLPDRIVVSFTSKDKMRQFLQDFKSKDIITIWNALDCCVLKVPKKFPLDKYIRFLKESENGIKTVEAYPVNH